MAFVKLIKTRAYSKRFQTRFRRRREGKTDYFARQRLITQDKNKYDTPKYRLVARFTNSRVIAQITYATIVGDKVLAQAESTELKRFGLNAGLTNYAASYATGLLLARRLLKKTKLDTLYKGADKIDGTDYNVNEKVDEDAEKKPFKAILDVGLANTTKGNKVFAVLKGACDGGIYIPHSTNKFPGAEGDKYNADIHRQRIFGVHVQKYMKELKDESQDDYNTQFSKWDAALKASKVDNVEKLYQKVHDEIRKNPDAQYKKKTEQKPQKFTDKRKTIVETAKGKYRRDRRLTHAERQQRVVEKIKNAAKSK